MCIHQAWIDINMIENQSSRINCDIAEVQWNHYDYLMSLQMKMYLIAPFVKT